MQLLDPKKRCLPPGYNSEAVEQLWQQLVRRVNSLTFMGKERFTFMQLSLFQLWNMWRIATPRGSGMDAQHFRRLLNGIGKEKHEERSKANLKAAEARRMRAEGARAKAVPRPGPGAAKLVPTFKGRFPIPPVMLKHAPRGFLEELAQPMPRGRRRFAHVPVALFRDNYDELLAMVRTRVPDSGKAVPNQTFAAYLDLQRWMVEKLKGMGR